MTLARVLRRDRSQLFGCQDYITTKAIYIGWKVNALERDGSNAHAGIQHNVTRLHIRKSQQQLRVGRSQTHQATELWQVWWIDIRRKPRRKVLRT